MKINLRKYTLTSILILSIILTFIAGCEAQIATSTPTQPAKPTGPQYGGVFKFAHSMEGASIGYPPTLSRTNSNTQAFPAVETLFRFDKAGKLVPWLASKLTEDAKTQSLSISLNKGIKFHDGTDFNADAVKWNLDQCMAKKAAGTEQFKSVDKLDDYSVRINLKEWDSTVSGNLAQTIGMIISPTAYTKNGEQWCQNNPVGTGPFIFVSWQKDVKTVYKKFDGYWQKGKPYLDGIEFNIIVDTVTRTLSVRKGELDLGYRLDIKDYAALEKEGFIILRSRPGSGAYGLVPNSIDKNSPWAELKVRQAAQHAIDTESIVKSLFYNEYEAANQWIYKGHWGYNSLVAGYPYNPGKAKQLLTEAGFPDGFTSKATYITSAASNDLYVALQAYFKAVGINVELNGVQQAKFDEMAYRGGTWDGLMQGNSAPNPDLAASLLQRLSGLSAYYTKIKIPEDYLNAIKNAVVAPDFETKQKNTQEAMKLMIDKYCLIITLYCGSESVVSAPYVHNFGFISPYTAQWTPEDIWIGK